ncbi:MAG: lipocalin family protein [Thiohalocapsa sp.]|uniref:lipocalin family protein n=1 Tax=Thiohalocapsa sp. TaxID=2497641 RepID=UPI0025D6569B|nr:lipocalin family protein [Thiohalocapsa sp.]MCG6940093.1 lipocalin family protein [Thiohalocapsa sp.]
MHRRAAALLAALALILITGCVEGGGEPMETVPYVDLKRFMGDWYVVANIPTFVEKGAYNPVESYKLNPDGTIATTFTFNKDGFDGPLKTYHPKGFVLNKETNAHWGMQFIWPFKGDFRIIYLDDDYQTTVIGRAKRDYVWVMSRTPEFSDAEFDKMKAFIESVGYDASKLQRCPHETG